MACRASEWLPIPVPALVDTGVFAAVQEQLQDNRRHAQQSRRGARYLLQGLVQCRQWLYLLRQTDRSHRGQGQDPYLRVLPVLPGTDAYRFGGERVCTNPQVRTDLLRTSDA